MLLTVPRNIDLMLNYNYALITLIIIHYLILILIKYDRAWIENRKYTLMFLAWYENYASKLLWKSFDVICLVVSATVDFSYLDNSFI